MAFTRVLLALRHRPVSGGTAERLMLESVASSVARAQALAHVCTDEELLPVLGFTSIQMLFERGVPEWDIKKCFSRNCQ